MPHLFAVQRAVGEELLAAAWHASSIAIGSQIGSAWVLFDPSRRIRVHMRADLANVLIEVSTTHRPGRPLHSPLWTLTVHHAPVKDLIGALRAAPAASEGGTGRDRRAIIGALSQAGMLPDRSRLARTLSGTAVWRSPGRDLQASWCAPCRAQTGGWQVLTPTVHLDASPATPAAVLAPMIAASLRTAGTEMER
ncbi:hypothetical protein ABIA31_002894 [Catenulispora sp. MAP5-51]|uniref:hypothetical protein n=1 Tax=Catenulispora sp. MAP5-51 TaxID=3156298 RepID=UPI0035178EA0